VLFFLQIMVLMAVATTLIAMPALALGRRKRMGRGETAAAPV